MVPVLLVHPKSSTLNSLSPCSVCVLSILGQTHQLFSNIQCFSTVTYFMTFVIHHCSEIPNILSAFHDSEDLPQVRLHNLRKNTPGRQSPSIVSVLWHASRIFPSSPGQTHSEVNTILYFTVWHSSTSAVNTIQCFTVWHSSSLLHHPKSNTSITFTTYCLNAKIHFKGVFIHPI